MTGKGNEEEDSSPYWRVSKEEEEENYGYWCFLTNMAAASKRETHDAYCR